VELGSTDDVARLLRDHGVRPGALACRNVRTFGAATRRLACAAALGPADVETLRARMGLVDEPRPAPPASPAAEQGSCLTAPGFAGARVLGAREVKNTMGLKGLQVWIAPGGAVCLETAYGWG
jgi:hypothetical protein